LWHARVPRWWRHAGEHAHNLVNQGTRRLQQDHRLVLGNPLILDQFGDRQQAVDGDHTELLGTPLGEDRMFALRQGGLSPPDDIEPQGVLPIGHPVVRNQLVDIVQR
jgi:hypothetical protein